ncbi:MAG: bifunctional DNA-formamidopyrimidine glycosylase/DNA-(apurinic or apyrimidinic site) lyase [candidate division NC10 bacterium]|nr:bifunctional DNA-formamidopyrimidine glycosylase/DNA-(apurinic or apyrimidinic site) lyase [candidate division NC10 bacterium]
MPELPEVEAIRLALNPLIAGKEICKVTLSPGRVMGKVDGGKIRKSLLGRKIVACLRRGKYLILQGGDFSLLLHFGMSGGLTLFPQPSPPGKHTHLVMGFSDRSQLHYTDPRTFGRVRVYGRLSLAKIPELARLGADPWEEEVSPSYLEQALCRRKAPIKVVLMDQSLIAGIGNIYASEILFHAQIDPLRPACRLRWEEVKGLHRAIQEVLQAAILKRGTSIISFRDAEGRRGGYQKLLQVYGREGEPCPRCRTAIVNRRLAGRSTYFCPHCQGSG